MKKVFTKVGQSTLEYVIVLTAIVAAILFAAAQFIKPNVNKVYSDAGTTLNQSGSFLVSHAGTAMNTTTTSTTTGGTTTGGSSGYTP